MHISHRSPPPTGAGAAHGPAARRRAPGRDAPPPGPGPGPGLGPVRLPGPVRRALAGAVLVMARDQSLGAWRPLVMDALQARLGENPRTAQKAVSQAERLFRFLGARSAAGWSDVHAALVRQWLWAAWRDRSGSHRETAQSTARSRQWVARLVFEEAARLGAPVDASELVGERVARPAGGVSARPLTSREAESLRDFADAGHVASRRSLMVALSFAGGSASEIAAVRRRDVDAEAGTVLFTGRQCRVGPLDGWGAETVARFLRNNPPAGDNDLLCVTAGADVSRGAHSVAVRLGQALRDAAISGRPGVTARSIRLTAARRVLDERGIEAAARFLGSPSLDTTAAALGHEWMRSGGR